MSKQFPHQKWPLPEVIDPDDDVCYTVSVPNDRAHIGAFLGALAALGSGANWADDPMHKARDVAVVWREIADNLVKGSCGGNPSDDMQFRQNGCKLEYSVDCTTWLTLYDPTDCIREITGTPQEPGTLAPGDCKEWDVQLSGGESWLLPIAVNDNYTIEVSDAKGAWNDGGAPNWYCPDGTPYILGQCVGVRGHVGGDPSGSAYHMGLIGVIETGTPIVFDPLAGQYTVPTSTHPQQLHFQANDSTISDNSGAIQFHLKVCNAATADWTHVFNFLTSDGGWVGRSPYSAYVGGAGWEDASGALYVRTPTKAANYTLTFIHAEFIVVTPDSQTGGNVLYDADTSFGQNVELFRNNSLFQTGGTLEWTGSNVIEAGDVLVYAWSGNGATSAHVRLRTITLSGTGTDPF